MRGDSFRRFLPQYARDAQPYTACDAASRLETGMSALESTPFPTRQMREDFEDSLAEVLRELRAGRVILDYRPAKPGIVTIPPLDHPMHLQALLFWTMGLKKPFQRVLEAARRCGDGASSRQVLATIRQIDFEDRMCRTDEFLDPRVH